MEFTLARKNMVNCQLRPNKIKDNNIINAFLNVPREMFVKKHNIKHAYLDDNLSLGNGRYLLNPVILGRLIQSLEIEKNETVLNIASGTGYGVVILSFLADTVLGIESEKNMIDKSSELLLKLNINNAAIIKGDIKDGFVKQAPYDSILIEGAVEEVPKEILNQLSNQGKLVAVESNETGYGKAVLFERFNDNFVKNILFDAYVPLLGAFKSKRINNFEF